MRRRKHNTKRRQRRRRRQRRLRKTVDELQRDLRRTESARLSDRTHFDRRIREEEAATQALRDRLGDAREELVWLRRQHEELLDAVRYYLTAEASCPQEKRHSEAYLKRLALGGTAA